MPGGAEIAKLLPTIIRLFPQLVKTSPTVGKIVPLMNVNPETDPEAERALDREIKVKQRTGFNDAAHVIKCSDVKTCIEKQFTDTTLIWEFVKAAAQDLVAGRTVKAPAQDLADKIMTCVRENVLRQDTIRVKGRFRSPYARPAVGHGTGRGSF